MQRSMKRPVSLILVPWICVAGAHAEEKAVDDPFVKKFGGPYHEGVSPEFRKNLVAYCGGLLGAFGSLGIDGLKDREDFIEFCKEFVDPALAKLIPKSDEEKKMKEAALQVKAAHSFVVDPALLPEADRKAVAEFLAASMLPGEPANEVSGLGGVLIRFSAYSHGINLENYLRLLEETKRSGGGPE
jgi:hypothetical protein